MQLISPTTYPRLKSGVTCAIVPIGALNSSALFVGNNFRGTTLVANSLIEDSEQLDLRIKLFQAIVNKFDGRTSAQGVANKLDCEVNLVTTIIQTLLSSHLVDIKRSVLKVNGQPVIGNNVNSIRSQENTKLETTDGAVRSLVERLQPELELATWYEEVVDGGIQIIQDRINFPILIFGIGRIAINACALLQASGFQSLRLLPRTKEESRELTASFKDISGGYLRSSDCGIEKSRIVDEMNSLIALFPAARDYTNVRSKKALKPAISPRLIVSVGWPSPDYLQRWMSESVPFLVIDEFNDRSISIGPLVRPGKSACLNCIQLTLEERDPIFNHISNLRKYSPRREVPASIASFIAGLISLEAISISDSGKSSYEDLQVIYSLADINNPHRFRCGLHPECACHQ